MEAEVLFRGPGPYALPVAQSATAVTGTDAVTVIFRVLVNPSQVEAVQVQAPHKLALQLAAAIAHAVPDQQE
jgi:hypothetical protein